MKTLAEKNWTLPTYNCRRDGEQQKVFTRTGCPKDETLMQFSSQIEPLNQNKRSLFTKTIITLMIRRTQNGSWEHIEMKGELRIKVLSSEEE